MSDLVERLHERAESYRQSGPSAEHTAVMLEQASSRISQQDAELERLREALKPFALAATIFEQEYGDRMKSDTGCNIKFAVLCQARDALRAKAEETNRG